MFGLYVAEDIVNVDGKVVSAKDSLVGKAVTWKDGRCVFLNDLPLGRYHVKEMEAPKGYVLSGEVFNLDASYQGEYVKVIELKAEFENHATKLEISKTDINGGHELDDAVLSIIDKDGHAESEELPIAVFKDGNYVEDIKYFVVEMKAAEGYILDSMPHEAVLNYEGDVPDLVKHTLKLTNTSTEPKLPQTGDYLNLWLIGGLGLIMMAIGVFVLKKCR